MNRNETDFGEETELQKLLHYYEEEALQNPSWSGHANDVLEDDLGNDNDELEQSMFGGRAQTPTSVSSATGGGHGQVPLLSPSSSTNPKGSSHLSHGLKSGGSRAVSDLSLSGLMSPDSKDDFGGRFDDDMIGNPRQLKIKEEAGSKKREEGGAIVPSTGGKSQAVERRRRDSHNEFERRRRDAINAKLTELKHLVPSLNNLVSNKATVLSKAIDYISQLANENTRANFHIHQLSTENSKALDVINQLNDENSELRAQIEVLRIGLTQKDGSPVGYKEGSNKRVRKDATSANPLTPSTTATIPVPPPCVPDEVLKQFVASALALTTRSLVVADATHPNMPLVYASLGFQLMTGYSQDEILGRNCNFLQGRNTSPLTRNVIRNALREKQEVLVEILNYKKDGTPFWNLLFVTPILDSHNSVSHYLGLQFDITETKCLTKDALSKAADLLQHNPRAETFAGDLSVLYVPNETLKHLIASALRLIMRNIVVTDPKQSGNPIIYCTQGACQMTQYGKDEILGRNGGFLQGAASDPVTKSQIGKALRESRECLAEMLNYKKDGLPFWNLMFITPVLDALGKPFLFIGVQYDITLR